MKALFKVFVVISILAFSCSAFAAGTWPTEESGNITCGSATGETVTVPLSPKVVAIYNADTTTNGTYYAIGTKNLQGNRVFATNESTTSMYFAESTTETPPAAASNVTWASATWKQL